MKERILDLLSNTDGYISGQHISELLGVSRTAVWKNIQRLQEEGYVIEGIKNKGYRLAEKGDILSLYELKYHMDESSRQALADQGKSAGPFTGKFGSVIHYYDEIDSTNLQVKRLAETGAPEGTLVVGDCQVKGRGRLGRVWTSPSGCGLWMSLLLRPEFSPMQASMVTLAAAMAVRDGIYRVTGIEAGIKWPNDLVCNGKKICGILTEMSMEENRISYIVAGIGINVNNRSFPEELQEKAVSLAMLTGKNCGRAALAAAVCRSFEQYYEMFTADGNLKRIVPSYNQYLINRGRQVVISDHAGYMICTSEGIDETGALLVVREDGTREAITSGEVSVRGIYGYV